MASITFQDLLGALAGGLLIGLAATLLLWGNGRIAGISGILFGALRGAQSGEEGERGWRWLFLIGVVAGAWLFHQLSGASVPAPPSVGTPLLLLGGLLVGLGTRLGSGCTSGHGVCGLARLSPRSLAATLMFIGVGMLTVWLLRLIAAGGGL